MINKAFKLDLRKERSFFKTAQKEYRQDFAVYWRSNSPKTGFQVVVAKATAATAVQRNELKRSVFDVLRSLLPEYAERKLSLVVVVKSKKLLNHLPELKELLLSIGSMT